jgi:hypothetical protein
VFHGAWRDEETWTNVRGLTRATHGGALKTNGPLVSTVWLAAASEKPRQEGNTHHAMGPHDWLLDDKRAGLSCQSLEWPSPGYLLQLCFGDCRDACGSCSARGCPNIRTCQPLIHSYTQRTVRVCTVRVKVAMMVSARTFFSAANRTQVLCAMLARFLDSPRVSLTNV